MDFGWFRLDFGLMFDGFWIDFAWFRIDFDGFWMVFLDGFRLVLDGFRLDFGWIFCMDFFAWI